MQSKGFVFAGRSLKMLTGLLFPVTVKIVTKKTARSIQAATRCEDWLEGTETKEIKPKIKTRVEQSKPQGPSQNYIPS